VLEQKKGQPEGRLVSFADWLAYAACPSGLNRETIAGRDSKLAHSIVVSIGQNILARSLFAGIWQTKLGFQLFGPAIGRTCTGAGAHEAAKCIRIYFDFFWHNFFFLFSFGLTVTNRIMLIKSNGKKIKKIFLVSLKLVSNFGAIGFVGMLAA
jgi:hypothetical protein